MANEEHLARLKQGVEAWNQWRVANPYIRPDLSEANLQGADLSGAFLDKAYLRAADLSDTTLIKANLSEATLIKADLRRADLSGAFLDKAYLRAADLSDATLNGATFNGADLPDATLIRADLTGVNFAEANLADATLTRANFAGASLAEADLTRATLTRANLTGANLCGAHLTQAHLTRANLREAHLSRAHLTGTLLREADLTQADLTGTLLSKADLTQADLREANLREATLTRANFTGANLAKADLVRALLTQAFLTGVNLAEAYVGGTNFADVDLSTARGLDMVLHVGPSTIGIDTLYRSNGNIPETFLRGVGVPDEMITYMKSLVGRPFEFYSCFISYSTKDQAFAERLHADLQNKGVRCWFAPEDIQGGRKLHEQIDQAIRRYDRLLLILSTASMQSEWVKTEIAKARQREVREERRVLFPMRLVSFEAVREWECFDADTGKDSAREIREYFIPDFSNWKNYDAYQEAFQRLLRDLKAGT